MVCPHKLSAQSQRARREGGAAAGAAIRVNGDWSDLDRVVAGTAFNDDSREEKALKFFYSRARGGAMPPPDAAV